jgi:ubiquinone/menaquinone biosynthesis C-methylase UbiE
VSQEEREITKLLEGAELDVNADNFREAGEKLHQAIRIAEEMGNKELLNQIYEFIKSFTFGAEIQPIELDRINTDGFILDIGGGGQGVIGKLNGKQVIAIDTSERELAETRNEALKVVMDATDLKFLPKSFDVCTSFFSLMYIPKKKHSKVFEEAYRALKDNGRFLVWDVKIPEKLGKYKAFMVRLKIRLNNEWVEAGYGVKWRTQDIKHFKELARKTKFKILSEWSKREIFYLEMSKDLVL